VEDSHVFSVECKNERVELVYNRILFRDIILVLPIAFNFNVVYGVSDCGLYDVCVEVRVYFTDNRINR